MKRLNTVIISVILVLFSVSMCFSQEIKAVPDYSNALNLYENQMYTIAIDAFKEFQKNHPTDIRNAEAQYYIGKSYLELGDFSEAKTAFEEFRLKYRDSALYSEVFDLTARCFLELGEPEKAAQLFEAKADIFFRDSKYTVPALFEALQIYRSLKNSGKTTGILYRIIDIYPDHEYFFDAVIMLANLHADKGDYLNAIREINRVENSDAAQNKKWTAQYYKGVYELRINKISEGIETLNAIISSAPAEIEVHENTVFMLADHYLKNEDFTACQSIINTFSRNSSADEEALAKAKVIHGKSLYLQEEYEESINVLGGAREILDEGSLHFRECSYYLGACYAESGDSQKAFDNLNKLFTSDWFNKYSGEGIPDFELEAFSLFIKTSSLVSSPTDISLYSKSILEKSESFSNAETFLLWGDLFFESSILQTARDLYEKGYNRFPEEKGSDFLLMGIARTYEPYGEYKTSFDLLKRVILNFPGGEAAKLAEDRSDYISRKFSLLTTEEKIKKRDEVSEEMLRASEQNNIIFGRHFYELREFERSLEYLERIIDSGSSDPNYGEALRYSAMIHDDLNYIFNYENKTDQSLIEKQEALALYRIYVENSNDQNKIDSASRRILDLSIDLTEGANKKMNLCREKILNSEELTVSLVEHAKYCFSEQVILHLEDAELLTIAEDYLGELNPGEGDVFNQQDIFYLLVKSGVKTGDNSKIITACSKYMSVYPAGENAPEVRYLGAKALLESGDTDTAGLWLDQLKTDFYYSTFARESDFLYADLLVSEGKTAEALPFYQNGIRRISERNDPTLLASLLWKTGNAYSANYEYKNAIDHYNLYKSTVDEN
ncbi:tetratricopeptide repeat protein, partial [candidate division KSB1 bacterium]